MSGSLDALVASVTAAADLASAARLVAEAAATALGASASSLAVADGPGSLRLVGLFSAAPQDRRSPERLRLAADHPAAEAVREQRLVEAGTVVAIPLLCDGRCAGALVLGLPPGRALTAAERSRLEDLTRRSAPAIERIAATSAAAEALAKLTFLAGASEALAGSLDYEATLRTVADLAVPMLADWCTIDLLEDGRLRRVAVSHVDPAKVALAWELWERYPPSMDAPSGPGFVLRTGVSQLVETVDDALLDQLQLGSELRSLIRDLQLNSGLTVALRARGRTLGVLSLVYAESGRQFGPDDVRFAEDLARRAALAIDNAELHTETLQAALQLQRAVLPSSFEDTASWRVAVHYRPAGRSEVGGDFFDAHTLPDGRLVALVGDVMGRGIDAAAAMAQIRSALRAYLVDDPDPPAVVHRLDRMFEQLDLRQMVTVAYGLLDPATGRGRWHSAGHLPPLVVHADSTVERLALPSAPPVGVGIFDRPAVELGFAATDTFLLYSDGLVERRGEDLDDGLARLTRHAAGLADRLDDDALAGLADTLRQGGHDDDVTILGLRPLSGPLLAAPRSEASPARSPRATRGLRVELRLQLPRDRRSVPIARHLVASALREAGAAGDEAYDVEVAVSEACSNVIEHAGLGDVYDVLVSIDATTAELRVVDVGRGFDHASLAVRPPTELDVRGRGLRLMEALVDQVRLRSAPERGAIVHLIKRLGPEAPGPGTPTAR